MRQALRLAMATVVVLFPVMRAHAQVAGKGPAVRLQVVFERYEKDKKVSSVPYTVSLVASTPNEPFLANMTRVRMGVQVPMHFDTVGPDKRPVPGNVVYKDVGDALDCGASAREDGRFLVRCNFEQSSVTPNQNDAALLTPPLIRTFRSEAYLVLGDGQTGRHSAGVDRVTGETVSVDVTLTVVK